MAVLSVLSNNIFANEELINKCNGCHGDKGNSLSSFAPSIAGMQKYYMSWVIDAYINNNRPPGLMKGMVEKLSANEIVALANYYSKQKFVPATQETKDELAQKGRRLHNIYCEKCHENGGEVSNELPGLLAGQWMAYTRSALKNYVDGMRKGNSMMKIKIDKMLKNEGSESIEHLVHFYGSKK